MKWINLLWFFINVFIIVPYLLYHLTLTSIWYEKVILGILVGAMLLTEGYNAYNWWYKSKNLMNEERNFAGNNIASFTESEVL